MLGETLRLLLQQGGFPPNVSKGQIRRLMEKVGGDNFLFTIEYTEDDAMEDFDHYMLKYQGLPVLMIPVGAPFLPRDKAHDVAQRLRDWMATGEKRSGFWGMFDTVLKQQEEAEAGRRVSNVTKRNAKRRK